MKELIKTIKSELNNNLKSQAYLEAMKSEFYEGIVYSIKVEGLKKLSDIEKQAIEFTEQLRQNQA